MVPFPHKQQRSISPQSLPLRCLQPGMQCSGASACCGAGRAGSRWLCRWRADDLVTSSPSYAAGRWLGTDPVSALEAYCGSLGSDASEAGGWEAIRALLGEVTWDSTDLALSEARCSSRNVCSRFLSQERHNHSSLIVYFKSSFCLLQCWHLLILWRRCYPAKS